MKLYIQETGTQALREYLSSYDWSTVFTSVLAPLEIRSALERRNRSDELTEEQFKSALIDLHEMRTNYTLWPLDQAVIDVAYQVIGWYSLRALDALQLGSALHLKTYLDPAESLVFIASDDKLLRAAAAESLATWNPTKPAISPSLL